MIKDSKVRVQISVDKERLKTLKKLAIDKDTSLSNLLISACEVLVNNTVPSKEL